MLYSDYSAGGFNAASMALDEGLWKPLSESRDHSEQLSFEQTDQEKNIIELASAPDSVISVPKKYNKALHLFNFHSWLPLYVDYLNPEFTFDPEHIPVSPGISLISQNRLSTAVSQLR